VSDNQAMSEKLRMILTELRQHPAAHYGERLVEVVLFGSQARGEAVEGSDIDVLIVLRGEVDPSEEIERTGELVAALSLKYDVLVSTVFVSEDSYLHSQMPLLISVRREGIRI